MNSLRMRELDELLPDVEELRDLRRALLQASAPNPESMWAASGDVGTAGERDVMLDGLEERVAEAVEAGRLHLEALTRWVMKAVSCVGDGDWEGAARAFLEASALEAARNRRVQAAEFARAAHRQATRLKERGTVALCLRRWGRALRGLGRIDEALARYREAFEIGRALDDVRGTAEAAIGAGNALEQAGRWSEAEAWYETALDALGGLPGPDDEVLPEHWHVAVTLHIVHRTLGRIPESEAWLEKAEALVARKEDPDSRVFLANARGQLYMAHTRPQQAAEAFLDGLLHASDPYAIIVLRLNLAESLASRGLLLDAVEEARMAEAEAIGMGVDLVLPHVYRTLGRCASALGNPDAFVLLERALEFPGSGGQGGLERAMTLQAYAEAEAGANRLDTAVELLAEAGAIYRSLGVAQYRRRWVDCFDAGSIDALPLQASLLKLLESR